jgi:hypothetical protein
VRRLCRPGEARQAMAQIRRGGCLEKHRFFRDCKFGKRSNQSLSLRTLDDRFIARELAIECHPHSREPEERMEPQGAQRNFVEQADQIVASFCVGHFMKQHSVQFLPVE